MGTSYQNLVVEQAGPRKLRTGMVAFCILVALMFLILPVAATPTAKFTASPTTGDAPLKVTFTSTSTCDTDDCDYEWDFDDGDTSTSSSKTVTHTFDEEGTYEVTLTITNEDDETDDYSKNIEVAGEALEASFTSDIRSGIVPLTVEFEDTSTGDPEEWYWTFGDGNTSTEQDPEHTYVKKGTYKVTLKVTNDDDTDSVSKSAYIDVGAEEEDPDADFTADKTEGDAPLTVQFTDKSDGYPSAWKWTFGDGETSTKQNPEHEYEDEGTYTVTLKVTNDEGTDTLKKEDYILVGTEADKPVASFVASATTGTTPLTVTFTDTSDNDPTSWYWTFGDGTTAATQNPSHTYTTAGSYTVTLKVTNDAGSNTVTKSQLITISPKTTVPTTVKTTTRTTVPTTRPTTVETTAPPADIDTGISWPIVAAIVIVAVVIIGFLILRKGRGGMGRWDL